MLFHFIKKDDDDMSQQQTSWFFCPTKLFSTSPETNFGKIAQVIFLPTRTRNGFKQDDFFKQNELMNPFLLNANLCAQSQVKWISAITLYSRLGKLLTHGTLQLYLIASVFYLCDKHTLTNVLQAVCVRSLVALSPVVPSGL